MPVPSRFPLVAWIAAAPGRALAAFLLLHAAVWTALPTLLYPNLPLDLIEALTYGREWQLGYDKLPPLPWWLVEIVYRLAGHDFAYYLLAQVRRHHRSLARLADRAAAHGPDRCVGGRADRRWLALLQLHRGEIQSRRHPAAVLGTGRICVSSRFAPADGSGTGSCSALRSGCRCGRNISWSCWQCRSRCSFYSTATRARA